MYSRQNLLPQFSFVKVAVGSAGLAVGSSIRFLTTQDACVRGNSHDEVPMEPTMHGRLASAMTTTVSRRHGTPDGDDGDSEPMWSLELP
jgi:hypothetical protein